MDNLSDRILHHATSLPKYTPIRAKSLYHLGKRSDIGFNLTKLTRTGRLLRVARGLYIRPTETRYGTCEPTPQQVVDAVSRQTGETIARDGVLVAHELGLISKAPKRTAFLTSGPTRNLRLGPVIIRMLHAPRWQFLPIDPTAADAIRALAAVPKQRVGEALILLSAKLTDSDLEQIRDVKARLPPRLAEPIERLSSVPGQANSVTPSRPGSL
jgi:Family of unknown function (DUF6088)